MELFLLMCTFIRLALDPTLLSIYFVEIVSQLIAKRSISYVDDIDILAASNNSEIVAQPAQA